jgi:hypothetical protein
VSSVGYERQWGTPVLVLTQGRNPIPGKKEDGVGVGMHEQVRARSSTGNGEIKTIYL